VFRRANGSPWGKSDFRISEIRAVIASFDNRLAEVFQSFYERSINFGGHPNPHAAMVSTRVVLTGSAGNSDPAARLGM
jgi:hypothetical protein